MKITTITRSNASQIKNLLEGAMKSTLESLGLELTWGRGTFNDKNYDMKISVHVKSDDVKGDYDPNTRMATDFLGRAMRYGLKRITTRRAASHRSKTQESQIPHHHRHRGWHPLQVLARRR